MLVWVKGGGTQRKRTCDESGDGETHFEYLYMNFRRVERDGCQSVNIRSKIEFVMNDAGSVAVADAGECTVQGKSGIRVMNSWCRSTSLFYARSQRFPGTWTSFLHFTISRKLHDLPIGPTEHGEIGERNRRPIAAWVAASRRCGNSEFQWRA